jgi:hypothetical protein
MLVWACKEERREVSTADGSPAPWNDWRHRGEAPNDPRPRYRVEARLSRKSGVSSGGFKTIWGWASALSRVIASSRF